ncbi:MAG: pilus assembly protein N-terminal domain-containing protein [Myxococcaceae bacterium]|jgi:hypothetical protein|nr:pilus assembly protein N-terminal domain-containing protein [Myxococcaceae bacterium]MCA3012610.1 pilus assembly protein N-terminal domain-containing protein [Myxococcaceae bacterium]
MAQGADMVAMLMAVALAAADGGVVRWDGRSAVKLVEGQVVTLQLQAPPTRVSASDGARCDVQVSGPSTLVLTAKRAGVTTVALWYGAVPRGLQVEVAAPPVVASPDAGVPRFTWDGTHGLAVPRGRTFVLQGPGGLEKVAPGSHRRCAMTSIGNDQLEVRCDEVGPVTVFLWYANQRRRTLELDVVDPPPDGSR